LTTIRAADRITMTIPPDDFIASLLGADAPVSAAQIFDHLAASHVQVARAFGFAQANVAPIAPAAAEAALTRTLGSLADAAADEGDMALLEDLMLALPEPASAEAAWSRMYAPEELAVGATDSLLAVYDLNAGPVTYDFVQFLVLAERFRQASGKPHLRLVIVPGAHAGFRNFSQRDQFLSTISKEWRLRQLVMRAAHLLPSLAGITRFRSRESAVAFLGKVDPELLFPPGFDSKASVCPYQLAFVLQFAAQGQDIRTLTTPPVTRALVRRALRDLSGGRPVVTITLRQSEFQAPRNSRIDQWQDFAALCETRGLFPLFVPDTEAVLSGRTAELGGFASLPLAALSLPIRAAIYQESWHNMLANGGPYTLCLYNAAARFSMFKLLVPGIVTASAKFHSEQGLTPGAQIPFAGPLQRLVWEDDAADVLERELDAVIALNPPVAPALRAATAARRSAGLH
jgi:hypothetical protein